VRYVILRDDDTSALTPVKCLERLYRPFLDRGLPVNLAVIPEVRTTVTCPDGRLEGYLAAGHPSPGAATVRLEESPGLVAFLRANRGFQIVQHGCFHDRFEFDRLDRKEAGSLLDLGRRRFLEAGLGAPRAFVAPHDRLSRAGLLSVAARFDLLSTGWFELGRVPRAWLPGYLVKKIRSAPHWRVGATSLLSHPGCLLSHTRPAGEILDALKREIRRRRVTVLVTHWWEYFRDATPDREFIGVLHATAGFLATEPGLRVITFAEAAGGGIPLD
jgi:hypothetical protein